MPTAEELLPEGWRLQRMTQFKDRLLGLMGRSDITEKTAWYFPRCRSIQTCFMRQPIDVIFISESNKVLKVYSAVSPWRVCLTGPKGTAATIECKANSWKS